MSEKEIIEIFSFFFSVVSLSISIASLIINTAKNKGYMFQIDELEKQIAKLKGEGK